MIGQHLQDQKMDSPQKMNKRDFVNMSFNKLTIIKESENEYSQLMMSEKQKDSQFKRMIRESGMKKYSNDLAKVRTNADNKK